MEDLQLILSDIPDPVFIVKRNQEISLVNEAALRGCGEQDPIGTSLHDLVYFAEKTTDASPAFFNNKWLDACRQPFRWNGSIYSRISLKKRKTVPDESTLEIVRNMVAALLHRLRSPLTGMQGYSNLIGMDLNEDRIAGLHADAWTAPEISTQDKLLDQTLQRCEKIYRGVQQLFDILDDLELLHKIPSENKITNNSCRTDLGESLRKILLTLSPENRHRIRYHQPGRATHFNCSPSALENILKILIDNAIENTLDTNSPISIELCSPHSFRITNSGPTIPEEILNQLFFPFVTSKVNNFGLGLTRAQIFASQQQASIFLSQNSTENGITFTFCLPPE